MKWISVVIKGADVNVAFDENSIHVYNAFPIKDDLKMRGYRWNPGDKSWHAKPLNIEEELGVLQNNLSETVILEQINKNNELAKFPTSCSVGELRNRIDRLIQEGLRGHIWVRGVIASEIKKYKWFCYFELKDEDESRDIYFNVEVRAGDFEQLSLKLRDSGIADALEKDLPVFVHVEVHLSLRNAVDVRLRLVDILPEYTQAKIRNQREITLDKLKADGVLDSQKRLSLSPLVYRLGLITSGQGTSAQDILAGLHPLEKKYQIYFVDTRMEGVNAVESVVGAIDYLELEAGLSLDAIIIARGGGSEQSLAVFNDYRLCRRICDCSIPVLTAIGHEKDIAAVEICSNLTPTPSTPSGIGKFLHDRFFDLQGRLSSTVQHLIYNFSNINNSEQEKVKAFFRAIPSQGRSLLRLREDRLASCVRGLANSISYTVRDHERRINNMLTQVIVKNNSHNEFNLRNIRKLLTMLFPRLNALIGREKSVLQKTVLRIDFEKRKKVNEMLKQEILSISRLHFQQLTRVIIEEEKKLGNQIGLVEANDPEKILKKGFSLTLDMNNLVVKSLGEFGGLKRAQLKFYDGLITIKKEEDS